MLRRIPDAAGASTFSQPAALAEAATLIRANPLLDGELGEVETQIKRRPTLDGVPIPEAHPSAPGPAGFGTAPGSEVTEPPPVWPPEEDDPFQSRDRPTLVRADLERPTVAATGDDPFGPPPWAPPPAPAPPTLVPPGLGRFGVTVTHSMDAACEGADVVMMLRVQNERMTGLFLPSVREYFTLFGLTGDRLKRAKTDAIVMHPGPMNRGVEIASDVADGNQSVILDQVANGVAVRMAVLYLLAGGENSEA